MGVCAAVGLWGRETDPSRGGVSAETQAYPVPRDERGADPAWVWVTAGDEELLATVAYPAGAGPRAASPRPLHAPADAWSNAAW